MTEIKKLENSEIEITGEISPEIFMSYKKTALSKVSSGVKIDGFRDGRAPEGILLDKIGRHVLLEKMAVMALEGAYQEIIKEHNLDPIGHPELTITKMEENNPLGFKLKTAVMPEVVLPDFKDIAKETNAVRKESFEAEDKEISEVLENLRKSRAQKDNNESEIKEISDNLPEINDDFAKTVGKFKNLDELKKAIGENIVFDKINKERERTREEILSKITEKMKTEIPNVMIESEQNKMLADMRAQITNMGMKWEDYLTHIKKTEDELKIGWKEDSLKRVKYGLILNKIAKEENINVSEEELEAEAQKATEHYEKNGSNVDKDRLKNYLYGVMQNEKVWKILEESR